MRTPFAVLAAMALVGFAETVSAADPMAAPYASPDRFRFGDGRPTYGQLWEDRDGRPPHGLPRRVLGGPDYVGSSYGLGKPAYSGIGPRPDWGRSSHD